MNAHARTKDRASSAPYDVARVREDFPILRAVVHGKPLVYLDNAGSAQKPKQVIAAETEVYETSYANIHRGIHFLSERATSRYEAARDTVRQFLNARSAKEIVFTGNATESINLVAASWGRRFLKAGDEIIISELEHHSNIVPWQLLRDELGLVIKAAPVGVEGEFLLDDFRRLVTDRTKLVAVAHMSNVLGTVLPVKRITEIAHAAGAKVLIDGCQAVAHLDVDVVDIDCDFYVFSGHKVYGPTGIGVLYGRGEILAAMPPYQGGGGMIGSVTFEKPTWAEPPARFEAGTPPIAQAIALGTALDYVRAIGTSRFGPYEADLVNYAMQRLSAVPGLTLIGTAPGKAAVVSFTMDAAHPHDIATIVDRAGIAVRAGHHCAQPLMHRLGIAATTRASFALYNTRAEVEALASALEGVNRMFGR